MSNKSQDKDKVRDHIAGLDDYALKKEIRKYYSGTLKYLSTREEIEHVLANLILKAEEGNET